MDRLVCFTIPSLEVALACWTTYRFAIVHPLLRISIPDERRSDY
jgi:hypothetical protein